MGYAREKEREKESRKMCVNRGNYRSMGKQYCCVRERQMNPIIEFQKISHKRVVGLIDLSGAGFPARDSQRFQ